LFHLAFIKFDKGTPIACAASSLNFHIMKNATWLLLLALSSSYGQLTIPIAQDSALKYHISSYSYLEEFIGNKNYGAPVIQTADGGAAFFGDGDLGTMLLKLDKTGKEEWKIVLPPKGDEVESQSVVQGKDGNFYVFQLVYISAKYRGGCERVAMISKTGKVVWDKYIGQFSQLNNPTVSYIKSLPDGRIALRGHIVKTAPPAGKDPTYLFWEGWLNSAGVLTQKTGAVIDWKKTDEWKARLKPE
jgi:hypothetical protein